MHHKDGINRSLPVQHSSTPNLKLSQGFLQTATAHSGCLHVN